MHILTQRVLILNKWISDSYLYIKIHPFFYFTNMTGQKPQNTQNQLSILIM